MGDRRYDGVYDALARASDRTAAMRALDDDEVVYALAAASRKMDAYLANVLAVEVLNRQRRLRARLWGAVAGLGGAVGLRTLLIAWATAQPGSPAERWLWLTTIVVLVPAALLGYAVYRILFTWRATPA